MIEILYSPITNELFLCSGRWKIDLKNYCMTVTLYSDETEVECNNIKQFEHIGWL